MPTDFPTAVDTTATLPTAATLASQDLGGHAVWHGDIADSIIAIEEKVGEDGSLNTNSHEYKIAQLEAAGGFVFTQGVGATVWTINHNLGMFPNVTLVDTLLRVFHAEVDYVDSNNITVHMAIATAGFAYLS